VLVAAGMSRTGPATVGGVGAVGAGGDDDDGEEDVELLMMFGVDWSGRGWGQGWGMENE